MVMSIEALMAPMAVLAPRLNEGISTLAERWRSEQRTGPGWGLCGRRTPEAVHNEGGHSRRATKESGQVLERDRKLSWTSNGVKEGAEEKKGGRKNDELRLQPRSAYSDPAGGQEQWERRMGHGGWK